MEELQKKNAQLLQENEELKKQIKKLEAELARQKSSTTPSNNNGSSNSSSLQVISETNASYQNLKKQFTEINAKYDILLCYSIATGEEAALVLKEELELEKLQGTPIRVALLPCLPKGFEFASNIDNASAVSRLISKCVRNSKIVNCSSSTHFAIILSEGSLAVESLIAAGDLVIKEGRRIVLIHDNQSCVFPAPNIQPPSFTKAEVFSDKAITFLKQYSRTCTLQVKLKLESAAVPEHKVVNVQTRAHKRSSAQGMAGRIFQGLKDDYRVFLDSEADFHLHDLEEIVKHTKMFIFILSEGILSSFWCLQELRAALRFGKRVLIIRDYQYQFPNPWPADALDVKDFLTNDATPSLVYMAEFYLPCIEKIKKHLGPPDAVRNTFEAMMDPAKFLNDEPAVDFVFNKDKPFSLDHFVGLLDQYYQFPFHKIRSLHIPCWKISSVSFQTLISKSPNLVSLDLAKTNITDAEMEALSKGNISLKFLSLENCAQLSPAGFNFLATKELHLESFNLSGTKINNSCIELLLKQDSLKNQLKNLNLAECAEITDEAMQFVTYCSSLETLDLSASKITSKGIKNLTSNHRFSVSGALILKKSVWIDDESLALISSHYYLASSIRVLDASWCYRITDAGLKNMQGGKFEKLEELNLSYCQQITDQGIASLVQVSCPKLQSLNLDLVNQLTNDALASIAKSPFKETLQHLSLNEVNSIDPERTLITSNAFELVASMPALKKLELDQQKIDDSALYHLAKSPSLTSISLLDTLVTNNGIETLVQSRPLHALCISGDSITEHTIELLLAHSKDTLQTLHIKRCPKLTDQVLELVGQFSNLKTVYISECRGLKQDISRYAPPSRTYKSLPTCAQLSPVIELPPVIVGDEILIKAFYPAQHHRLAMSFNIKTPSDIIISVIVGHSSIAVSTCVKGNWTDRGSWGYQHEVGDFYIKFLLFPDYLELDYNGKIKLKVAYAPFVLADVHTYAFVQQWGNMFFTSFELIREGVSRSLLEVV